MNDKKDETLQYVLKIINKHHYNHLNTQANKIKLIEDNLEEFQREFYNLRDFLKSNKINKITLESISNKIDLHSQGVKNVYDKFLILEKKQEEIESLLKSDRIKEILKSMLSENDIKELLLKVDDSKIRKLQKSIDYIKISVD